TARVEPQHGERVQRARRRVVSGVLLEHAVVEHDGVVRTARGDLGVGVVEHAHGARGRRRGGPRAPRPSPVAAAPPRRPEQRASDAHDARSIETGWARGSRTVNALPCPSSLSTRISPRCASTMLFTIARPSPVPAGAPGAWTYGSKMRPIASRGMPAP